MTPTVTVAAALAALDGMRIVIQHEMLNRGRYVSATVMNRALAKQGAICGGRQACAVGALWLGAGIEIDFSAHGYVSLPGAETEERDAFLAGHPALELAYDAMNEVCLAYTLEHDIDTSEAAVYTDGAMEGLFETKAPDSESSILSDEAMLALIDQAQAKIRRPDPMT